MAALSRAVTGTFEVALEEVSRYACHAASGLRAVSGLVTMSSTHLAKEKTTGSDTAVAAVGAAAVRVRRLRDAREKRGVRWNILVSFFEC